MANVLLCDIFDNMKIYDNVIINNPFSQWECTIPARGRPDTRVLHSPSMPAL